MTEEQLNDFIYSCLSFASNAHFDEERYIRNFIEIPLNERSFSDTIMKYYNIANNMHFGVCFTFACWAYHLLYKMGVEENYYILETVERETGYPNYVLLFLYNGEYRICDIALQTIRVEKAIKTLLNMSLFPDSYTEEDKNNALKVLGDSKYINCSIEDYKKEYSLGIVVMANGINDGRIFTEIPTLFLSEFLKEQENKGRS